jgi:small subunit ribosomal protein S7
MPRRNGVPKKEVLPDPKYNSQPVAKLINQVMLDGKKGIAQNIVYGALDLASQKLGAPQMDVFNQAVANVSPVVETKARRTGGANYQVPVEVSKDRRQTLAIRWLVNYSRRRSERTMIERLGAELVDAYNNTGASIKRKEEMHKMAEANKAFAHLRW